MKKVMLLSLTAVLPLLLLAQNFKSESFIPKSWDKNTVVEVSTEDGTSEVKILALSKDLKGTSKDMKPIEVNGEKYRILRTDRVINIQNEAEETLLLTSSRQMKVIMPNGQTFRKTNKSNRVFSFVNEEGKVVAEAKLRDNTISHKIEVQMHEEQPLLLALCVEMLVKRAAEDAYFSL
ncbi:MAG: hypothetical protein HRU41_16695 [Saprospiraceae bacterium]|nr:hypothetical protein [Saprospiraceae bacterium]